MMRAYGVHDWRAMALYQISLCRYDVCLSRLEELMALIYH